MSILDNEDILMESIGPSILKGHVKRFIKNQMSFGINGYTFNDDGLIRVSWVEIETSEFNFHNFYMNNVLGKPSPFPDKQITYNHPVEKERWCTSSDIYVTLDNKLVIVPEHPEYPMLLYGCAMIPDYIEFTNSKKDLNIFTFKCTDEINNIINKKIDKFRYEGSNISSWDRYILNEIYSTFGYYNSAYPKLVEFEKELKNKYNEHFR